MNNKLYTNEFTKYHHSQTIFKEINLPKTTQMKGKDKKEFEEQKSKLKALIDEIIAKPFNNDVALTWCHWFII